MGEISKIAWTDGTFNPWQGCTKVSPGCLNCYAEARDKRFTGGIHWGKGAPRLLTGKNTWREPVRWNEKAEKDGVRKRVFCASLADWLDAEVPIEWLARLLCLIRDTPHLDWLLLTKRPELFKERVFEAHEFLIKQPDNELNLLWLYNWVIHREPPANVWIGTSAEDQLRYDQRIPALLKIPAKVRFISAEPLLGPLDLRFARTEEGEVPGAFPFFEGEKEPSNKIDWIIIGGESGTDARQFRIEWARDILEQCRECYPEDAPAYFLKQFGRNVTEHALPVLFNDSKGGDIEEFSMDLRVREFPKT